MHRHFTRRPRRARSRATFALAALVSLVPLAVARVAGAQAPTGDSASAHHHTPAAGSPYPLVPTPVVDVRRLTSTPSLSGYAAVRQTRRNDSTLFAVSRARLTLMAAPRPYVALRMQGDFSNVGRVGRDSSVAASLLTDAFVQLTLPPRAAGAPRPWYATLEPTLLVGQFKTPFSLEYLTSFGVIKTANRSLAVDRLSLKRDVGAMAQLRATERVTVTGALVNGGGANVTRNADGRELAIGRVTLRPVSSLALSGKWANEGPDHLWGYDARWIWRGATVEGEALHRQGRAPAAVATTTDAATPPYAAGGGYVLGAYRVLSWLEPVVKWEQFREERGATGAGEPASETWLTGGGVVGTPDERLRLQLDWTAKRVHPASRRANELVAQLVVVY